MLFPACSLAWCQGRCQMPLVARGYGNNEDLDLNPRDALPEPGTASSPSPWSFRRVARRFRSFFRVGEQRVSEQKAEPSAAQSEGAQG